MSREPIIEWGSDGVDQVIISDDGTRLAFIDGPRFWIRGTELGFPIRPTTTLERPIKGLTFGPTSSVIVSTEAGIVMMDLDKGTETVITDLSGTDLVFSDPYLMYTATKLGDSHSSVYRHRHQRDGGFSRPSRIYPRSLVCARHGINQFQVSVECDLNSVLIRTPSNEPGIDTKILASDLLDARIDEDGTAWIVYRDEMDIHINRNANHVRSVAAWEGVLARISSDGSHLFMAKNMDFHGDGVPGTVQVFNTSDNGGYSWTDKDIEFAELKDIQIRDDQLFLISFSDVQMFDVSDLVGSGPLKVGDICPTCKAVVKNRALFNSTFVGCLC